MLEIQLDLDVGGDTAGCVLGINVAETVSGCECCRDSRRM